MIPCNYTVNCGCLIHVRNVVMTTSETLKLEGVVLTHCRIHRARGEARVPGGKTDTSVRAGEAARRVVGAVEAAVLGLLGSSPMGAPLTADRMAKLSGFKLNTVRSRCTHLQYQGKIRDSGQRHWVSETTKATAWELVR